MKSLYLSGVLLLTVLVCGSSAQKCHMREVDLCMVPMFLYCRDLGKAVPVDDAEIDKMCVDVQGICDCMHNFTIKCTTPVQREMFNLLSQNANETLKTFCTKGTEIRTNFLKHASCIREVVQMDELRAAIADVQAVLDVLTNVPKDAFSFFCCAYTRLRKALDGLIESKCGKEAIEFVHVMLSSLMGDIPDQVCGCMDPESSKCANLLPPPGTKPLGSKSKSPLAKLAAQCFPVN